VGFIHQKKLFDRQEKIAYSKTKFLFNQTPAFKSHGTIKSSVNLDFLSHKSVSSDEK